MKIPRLKLLITVVLSCISVISSAQVKLFTQVDEETIALAKAQNHEYLIQQLYTTKKHQFLFVNTDAFEQDNIDVTLFDDTLNLERSKPIRRSKTSFSYTWTGQNPRFKEVLYSAYGIGNGQVSPELEKKKFIANQTSSIEFIIGKVYEYISNDGEPLFRYKGDTRDVDFSIPANEQPKEYINVSANINYFRDGEMYILRHLPNTPNVHLLTIFDRDKSYVTIDGPGSEKLISNRQKYHAYLRRNGYGYLIKTPNPEKAKRDRWEYYVDQGTKRKHPEKRKNFYNAIKRLNGFTDNEKDQLIAEIESHFEKINNAAQQKKVDKEP